MEKRYKNEIAYGSLTIDKAHTQRWLNSIQAQIFFLYILNVNITLVLIVANNINHFLFFSSFSSLWMATKISGSIM